MTHSYTPWCSTCGEALQPDETDNALECPACEAWWDSVLEATKEYQEVPGVVISGVPWINPHLTCAIMPADFSAAKI